MTNAVTSDSSDLNISSSSSININTTITETFTRSLTGAVSAAHPVIVRVIILGVLAVFNVGGNGFTLITIRLTPRLWTKTNFILASMLVADVITGIFMLWYTPLLLVVYVFNNPCSYNAIITITLSLTKFPGHVSTYHLILISAERYIAIVYPLKYETKFTDRTLKWSIAAAWVIGMLMAISWSLWLINADLRKCDLVPGAYHLTDVFLGYLPVSISMLVVYGKILIIWWDQRKRIQPINFNPAYAGTSGQASTVNSLSMTQSSKVDSSQDAKDKPLASTGSLSEPAVTNVIDASADVVEQQRQQVKSRRREFKAVYLTGAIVGAFVILWFPNILGRFMAAAGYNQVVMSYVYLAGGALGASNFAFSWAIYAAVSKSYRRAYRQVLSRVGCCCCRNITSQSDNPLVV